MRYHVSDKAKRTALVWKYACDLYHMLQIDLKGIPKGNVIQKHSRQRRILRGGIEKIYDYRYENLDVSGVGQFHLPVKRKSGEDKLWELREKVLYRIEVENRIRYLKKQVETLIRGLNVYRGSKEKACTFGETMELVEKAKGSQERYERYQRELRKRAGVKKSGWDEVRIVTDLGERVRSKNECLFANKLREMGIPYLYEVLLENGTAPDFTVFMGKEVYYIELLGMMEHEEYREKLREKLEKYRRLKVNPGERLVLIDMTAGLDMRGLEKIVRDLFVGMVPRGIVRCARRAS